MRGIAETQLAAWRRIADTWPYWVIDGVRRCEKCGTGIMLEIDSSGRKFAYSADEIAALTVLHLRNHHPDLDPDKP